ncbi:RPM1-interacting protein 4-like [Asparagus officinalis]|uniref:RPM1-interacting protein 4-like n=1 Tax=Asparagus officinalis TaxID=4686 RepID=UPI00098E2010|nr:RPM1-interacting protein 4-like [Asparagus officinalis]XP_020270147.1 RPM1-interacting protein 4-like [Asparagus officinalis]
MIDFVVDTSGKRFSWQMHKTPSVPKFGVWDEKGPKSGDGFTVIFNKVKQEKQNAASKLPRVPIDPTIHPSKRKNRANPASRSKILCCIRPAIDE